ncbi:MAG: sodium:solute symporter family protein [Candidatus Hydrogenedentes bacterium]|nr:sodium:solute symporter family protein [Candidatus Hydrogenedentota bacterium]
MLGIGPWDWATLIFYFVVITAMGVWTARKVVDTSDFFMAGRRFGKVFMIFFSFGAGTSGNDAVGVSSKTFTSGLSGIWFQWLWLFCTPFYWLIAPAMRRMRCLTTGDYFEFRYDGSVAGLYSLIGVIQLTVNIGVIQLGAGSMVEAVTGGAIAKEYSILAMTVMFVIYGMAGGLAAAIVTDFIQGILTVILSFILLPFALHAVGGFEGLHRSIQDPHMFSLVAPGEINLFYIAMLCFSAIVGIVTQPHIMGVCAAGRTELDGRVGFAGGNLLKRLCTIAWTVVGLCAVVMYAGQQIAPDLIYGQMAKDLLPNVMPGLVGVFLAALIASVMSSCDAFMVSSSGLFTQNFYRRWFVTDRDEAHYVWVGRIAALVIVMAGVIFAFSVSNVPQGLLWFFKLQALMGAAFWLGLFWRRATVWGAWAATIAGLALLAATTPAGFHEWASGTAIVAEETTLEAIAADRAIPVEQLEALNLPEYPTLQRNAPIAAGTVIRIDQGAVPEYMIWEGKFRDSWQILIYLSGGFLAGILVSLFTPRVRPEKLDRVYACLRTPVRGSEPHDPVPFSLPPGVEPEAVRKLIDHPDLEFYVPTRESVVGFTILWLCVGGLIGFVYWMAGWGA